MRISGWILALYPRRFRERFAAGMRSALDAEYQRARARGKAAALSFLIATSTQAVWFGITERFPRWSTLRSFASTDLRDAVRSLRATPLITAVSIVSLALGIGANTALFSILNSLVIRQLPVRAPQELVLVGRTSWSNVTWEQIRDRQDQFFDSAGAWSPDTFNLAASGLADPVAGAYVSGGLFDTLGVVPVAGRPVQPTDDVRGGGPEGPVAVISHRFWQQRFGSRFDALGSALTIGGTRFTIVGVAPPDFLGPEIGQAMDVFLPLAAESDIRGAESQLERRDSFWLAVIARLRAAEPAAAAAAALDVARPAILEASVSPGWSAEYRANFLQTPMALSPAATGVSTLRERFEQPLTIILMVVGAVLLIACANIANLLLARASARRHEMAVRIALGASRLRLSAQLLVESLLLAAAGGLGGLAVAGTAAKLLVRQLDTNVSVTLDLSLDWRVLAFTAAASLGATLLFGLAPAFGMRELRPNDALKDQGRTVTGGRRDGLRQTLVVAQVALSFVLIAGAGLFVRTFSALATTPLGFTPNGLLIATVDGRRAGQSRAELDAFAERLVEAAAAIPGVSQPSLSYLTPLSGRNWTYRVALDGGPNLSRSEQTAWVNAIAPGWFDTYGMRLLRGRDFAPSDVMGGEPVAVVNEAFVRRFANGDPLGRQIRALGLGKMPPTTIVGVVNDAVYRTARIGVVPTIYLPMVQGDRFGSGFAVTARLTGNRPDVERRLAESFSTLAPGMSFSFRHYEDQIRATLVQERLVALLSGFFGLLALLLSSLGLYGVTAYAVSRKRTELAVRMALGASRSVVVRLVLRRVAALIVVGGVLGAGASLWAAKFVSALLFGVDSRDPATLLGAALVLTAVGLFAAWGPARAAARMDPNEALRG